MCGWPEANGRRGVLAVNGTVLDLSADPVRAVEYVETGRTYLDGSVQVGALERGGSGIASGWRSTDMSP